METEKCVVVHGRLPKILTRTVGCLENFINISMISAKQTFNVVKCHVNESEMKVYNNLIREKGMTT